MNAQEIIQARINELEQRAKEFRANARDLQKRASEADDEANRAEEQITELKGSLDVLGQPTKAEKKPATKKKG